MLKLNKSTYHKKHINSKTILLAGWGVFALTAAGIAGWTAFMPGDTHAATQIKANISNTGYYLNVGSSVGDVNMSVDPTASGRMTSAKDSLNVKTNIPTGYKLYMSADSSGDTKNSLYNYSTPSGRTPSSISASSSTLSATSTLANNTWGYGIPNTTEGITSGNGFDATYSAPNPDANSKWAGVPAKQTGAVESYAQLVQTINYDNSSKGGNNLDVYYAAKVDTSKESGFYVGNVTYTAVADMPAPSLTFDEAFHTYGKSKDTATNLYKMQDMSSHICNAVKAPTSASAGDEQTTTLVDTRDGKTYQVGKLADGNCWMQENLRLGSETESYTLTSANSNVSSDFTLPAMSKSTSWTGVYNAPYLYPSDDQNTDSTKGALGYYGYYYNYNAASAGTDDGTGTAELTSDICPKGWSIPSNYTSNPSRSYSNLLYSYGVISSPSSTSGSYATGGYAKMTSAPLNFVLSGFHSNSGTSVYYRGSTGCYWSGSSSSATYARGLDFDSSNVYPQLNYYKSDARVIRCLAK